MWTDTWNDVARFGPDRRPAEQSNKVVLELVLVVVLVVVSGEKTASSSDDSTQTRLPYMGLPDCRPIGVVVPGGVNWCGIYGSPMECLGYGQSGAIQCPIHGVTKRGGRSWKQTPCEVSQHVVGHFVTLFRGWLTCRIQDA